MEIPGVLYDWNFIEPKTVNICTDTNLIIIISKLFSFHFHFFLFFNIYPHFARPLSKIYIDLRCSIRNGCSVYAREIVSIGKPSKLFFHQKWSNPKSNNRRHSKCGHLWSVVVFIFPDIKPFRNFEKKMFTNLAHSFLVYEKNRYNFRALIMYFELWIFERLWMAINHIGG